MNEIIENILIERKGNYVHAIEIENKYELFSLLESIHETFNNEGYKDLEIIDFIETLDLYGLNNEAENFIYDFDLSSWIKENF